MSDWAYFESQQFHPLAYAAKNLNYTEGSTDAEILILYETMIVNQKSNDAVRFVRLEIEGNRRVWLCLSFFFFLKQAITVLSVTLMKNELQRKILYETMIVTQKTNDAVRFVGPEIGGSHRVW